MKKYIISFSISMLAAVFLSIILSLVYSVLATIFIFSSGVNIPINLLIKLLSVGLGCFMFVKEEKGALLGLIFGVVYFVVSALVFNLISNDWGITWFTLANIIYCAVVGVIMGIIKINVCK